VIEYMGLIIGLLAAIMFVQTIRLYALSKIFKVLAEDEGEEEAIEDGGDSPFLDEAMERLQPMELPILGTPDDAEEEMFYVV
jgi:hypothetical protein